MLNTTNIKSHFPILTRQINGHPLAYLDNAATTLTPTPVVNAIKDYYETKNANVHRGVHTLSEEATSAYEETRQAVAKFINAPTPNEIIFTRGSTEAINLVAHSWGNQNIQEGDEIILSELEHHSNLIPWQELARRQKATLKFIPFKPDFTLDLQIYQDLLSPKTKLVAITGMSNVTGYAPDLKTIITKAHQQGAKTLIDAAQLAAHHQINVQDLNCDFLTLSAHKMLGPTGVGILYGKSQLLQEMPPYQFGGSMIKTVTSQKAEYADPPTRFEAGTPNIANIIGFHAALKFLNKIGLDKIATHDRALTTYAYKKLSPHCNILSHPNSLGLLSFTIKNIHPHDIASIFNEHGIAIRGGHHCAEPLMQKLGIPGTARISLYLYNTEEEIDRCKTALQATLKIFQ